MNKLLTGFFFILSTANLLHGLPYDEDENMVLDGPNSLVFDAPAIKIDEISELTLKLKEYQRIITLLNEENETLKKNFGKSRHKRHNDCRAEVCKAKCKGHGCQNRCDTFENN